MQLLAMIRQFDRGQVRPHLCLLDGEDEISRSLEPEDCPVLRLGVRKLSQPSSAGKALWLGRFLRAYRIDVFQTHFPDSTYFGVPVAWLARTPRIIQTRRDNGYWVTPLHRRLGTIVSRFTHVTLANSAEARRGVIKDYRLDPERVVVLENGIDLNRFDSIRPFQPRGGSRGKRVVGMLANLRPVKDPHLFIQAASKLARDHQDVVFRIAGDGESREELEQLAESLGVRDRVEFLGSVLDVPAFLSQLDVAVLSSRSEGLSNALLEYMASGRPTVATSVGGNEELIEDGVDGVLVPAGDPDGMARAIGRLLCDTDLARKLGEAAREKVGARFSLMVKASELGSFYRSLLGPGGTGDRR